MWDVALDIRELGKSYPKFGIFAHRARAFVTRKPYFFNRQRMRFRAFRDIDMRVPFENYIETGTYLGVTTHFLAKWARIRKASVYSCEISADCYRIAKRTIAGLSNVCLYQGDSVDFLHMLSSRMADAVNFVYLDAHGHKRLPIREELLVTRNWPNTIVMIDDFKVPFDNGFGWDKYDDEREICLSHIADIIGARPVYFPNYTAEEEGVDIARGYCVIPMSDRFIDVLDGVQLLRRRL